MLRLANTNIHLPAEGGSFHTEMNNTGVERIVFKVLSSDPNYTVNSTYGFLEANANFDLEITRKYGAPKNDVIVVEYGIVPRGSTASSASDAFRDCPRTERQVIRLAAL
ncbi:unnamed protein product [Caenorhabditis auriculariae]|uniref:MSP domain-containing protein n=1 Tax=Caenorhabditis auriculariae TaxID=2777116 RepID=A0A8S1GT24_9PELO|nr:unnamed protein product [Caenorhabditis auriculariae]